MAAVTICSDFGAPQNKVWHCFHCFPHLFPMKCWDQMPWSLFSECWVLSQLFHSPLSLSSRSLLVTECYINHYPKYIKIITLKQYGYLELLLTNKDRLVFVITYSTKYFLLDSCENWYSLATLIFPTLSNYIMSHQLWLIRLYFQ